MHAAELQVREVEQGLVGGQHDEAAVAAGAHGDRALRAPVQSVDRVAMSTALYPTLARRKADGASERELRNVIAASAEGYAFPTNLDRDQPIGGLAPQTQAELVWLAIQEGWDTATLTSALHAHTDRRRTSRT